MLTVKEIIAHLEKASLWQDGESLVSISQRLTPEQLAGPGRLILRISERGAYPWLLRACVLQDEQQLFEVQGRIPEHVTDEDIQALVSEWIRLGYVQVVAP